MGFLDNFLGKRSRHDDWTATHQGIYKEISYDDIVAELGGPQRAKGGYVYWRGPLSDIDPEYPDDEYYQLSNKDFRAFGGGSKTATIDRDKWFVLGSSEHAIQLLGAELGALTRDVSKV